MTNEDKEVCEVISESRGTKYTDNIEDGTYTCADFKNRGEGLQALLQGCNGEGDRVMNKLTEDQIQDMLECLFHGQPEQVALALQILKEEDEEA